MCVCVCVCVCVYIYINHCESVLFGICYSVNIQINCHRLVPSFPFTSSHRLPRRHVHYCIFLIWLLNDFSQQPCRVPINAKRYQIHPTPTRQKLRFRRTCTPLFSECPLFKQRNSYSDFFLGFPLTLQTNNMIVSHKQVRVAAYHILANSAFSEHSTIPHCTQENGEAFH